MNRFLRIGLFYSAMFAVGCSGSSGGSGSSQSQDTGSGATTGGEQVPDTNPAPPLSNLPIDSCSAQPFGAVGTSGGDIVYHGKTITASARHHATEGCVNELDLSYAISGGCVLDLKFRTVEGGFSSAWALQEASFQGSADCGSILPESMMVPLQMDTGNSVGSVLGLATLPEPALPGCTEAPDGQLLGKIQLSGKDGAGNPIVFNLELNFLGFRGTIPSEPGTGTLCPSEPRTCQGVSCGKDYFSVDCGGCEEGFTCVGGSCEEGGCVPEGDGNSVGYHIADVTWKTSEGDNLNLHSLCGASAVFMIKVAGW